MKQKFFDYVEAALNETICNTYRKLAQYLDTPQPKISQWKTGKSYVSPAECVLLARLLGISTEEIAFVLKAEKEPLPERKQLWYQEAKRFEKPINPPSKYQSKKY